MSSRPSPTSATSPSGKNAARMAVMTLVAVIPNDEQAYAATRALRALGRHHPARIVLLRPDPDQVATLDGRAALYSVEDDGHQVNFEEVMLFVGGQAARHLDSLVEAFTLSDLPVPVWYAGDIPEPSDPLLSVATAVLIDTRDAADTGRMRSVLELARRRTVVDLSWVRLQPWRELLAGLFEPADRRPWLRSVERGRGHRQVRSPASARRLVGGPTRPPAPPGAAGRLPPRRDPGRLPPAVPSGPPSRSAGVSCTAPSRPGRRSRAARRRAPPCRSTSNPSPWPTIPLPPLWRTP